MIQILALYLDFEDAKNLISFKSSLRALEDAGGSLPGFGIMIMIWIYSDTLLVSFLKFSSHSDQYKLR